MYNVHDVPPQAERIIYGMYFQMSLP